MERNRHFTKHPVEVTELDFMTDKLSDRVLQVLPEVKLVIAADGRFSRHFFKVCSVAVL